MTDLPTTLQATDAASFTKTDHEQHHDSLHARYNAGGGAAWVLVAASDSSADVISKADYVCDGAADDVEINAAVATGDHVQLGGGTFYLTEGISGFAHGQTFAGVGRGGTAGGAASTLKASASFTGTYMVDIRSAAPSVSSLTSIICRDMLIDGYGGGAPYANTSGLCWGVINGTICNVAVERVQVDGIVFDGGGSPDYPLGAWDNFFTNIRVSTVGGRGMYVFNGATDNMFTACEVSTCTGIGIENDGAGNIFVGCYIGGCGGFAIANTTNSAENSIVGCRIRECKGGISLTPSFQAGFCITGVQLRDCSHSSDNTYDGIYVVPQAAVSGGVIAGVTFLKIDASSRVRYGVNVGANMTGLSIDSLSQWTGSIGTSLINDSGSGTRGAAAQPILATGASHTTDQVITVLQNLGIVRQS